MTYTASANVENLTLTGTTAINGTGNALDNVLTGNSAANTLTGGAGNDTLNGGAGIDTMVGGTGDDTYVVDVATDVVTEALNEGTDTIQSAVTYTASANVENLTLTGTTAINGTGNALDNILIGNGANNTLTGGAGNDTLDGGAGTDTMVGGTGNDTYVVDVATDVVTEAVNEGTDTIQSSVTYTASANVENLTLTGTAAINGTGNALDNILIGNSANNTLTGAAGNDTLNGGAGIDTMVGGTGNDTYVVDVAGDVVTENANEGTDTVQSSVTYTLGANVENLVLTGTANLNGTGNTLANSLTGNSGNNTLDGGTGADTMAGGLGNDTYVVDVATDVVTENANEGNDSVQSAVTYTLSTNVENLILTGVAAINGTGNALNNLIHGNSAANALNGGAGNDVLEGMDGNDTLSDTSGSNLLNGGAGIDVITGGAAPDFIVGGAGNDTINPGGGSDVIAFNRGDGADTVIDASGQDNVLSLGGGIRYLDLALSKISADLVVELGAGDSVTLKDWYAAPANHSVLNLQVIADAMAGFDANSPDPLLNKRVQEFDFGALVQAYDTARSSDPTLIHWQLLGSLLNAHTAASDTAAFGGDLAYQYGTLNGTLAGISVSAAQDVLGAPQLGAQTQTLRPLATLQQGTPTLS